MLSEGLDCPLLLWHMELAMFCTSKECPKKVLTYELLNKVLCSLCSGVCADLVEHNKQFSCACACFPSDWPVSTLRLHCMLQVQRQSRALNPSLNLKKPDMMRLWFNSHDLWQIFGMCVRLYVRKLIMSVNLKKTLKFQIALLFLFTFNHNLIYADWSIWTSTLLKNF